MIKWSKKICIEYIEKMRSPIEEQAGQTNPQGQGSLIERLRQLKARLGNVTEARRF